MAVHRSIKNFNVAYRHPSLSHFSQGALKQMMLAPDYGWKWQNAVADYKRFGTKGWQVFAHGEPVIEEIAEFWQGMGYDPFYRYNVWGYREDDYPDKPQPESAIAIGCSCTAGMGVPEPLRWSNKLQDKLGKKVWNFGVCGGGIDNNYRTLLAWLPIIQPKQVFLWHPPRNRIEFPYPNSPNQMKQMNARHMNPDQIPSINTEEEHFAKAQYGHMIKNQWWIDAFELSKRQAIETLCKEYDAELYIQDVNAVRSDWNWIDPKDSPMEMSRDGTHPGPNMHNYVAEQFAEMVQGAGK